MSEYFRTEKTELFVTALTRIEGINMGVIVLVDADEKREVGIPCDNEHLKALLQRRELSMEDEASPAGSDVGHVK